MNEEINFKVAPTLSPPTAAIRRVEPKLLTDCSKCEGNINIGIFFDGTNNNRDADRPKLKHTNVVRLFDSYLDKPMAGYFRGYIPGVGTRFPEIREQGESMFGNGFGSGCEERVLFGLLYVFNALHRSAFDNQVFLTDAQVTALCCNTSLPWSEDDPDSVALAKLGFYSGLRLPTFVGEGMRVRILKTLAQRLQVALSKGRPIIKECFIDVIGFSRGAAEARVFCSWLDEILTNGKLASVIVHFRFLGLMDTVASAGIISSVGAGLTGGDGGHSGWAEARYLRIPASVCNCVHMIAVHELRKNFPVDTITDQGKLPAHCQEFAYPGAHSDIGGGYAPGDLGIAFGADPRSADAHKLAQIPLNHMLECAIAAGAPMKKERARSPNSTYDPFTISPEVRKAYDDFLACSTLKPRPVHAWLQPYLNWRWEHRLDYASLTQIQKANEKDRALLIKYNGQLIADAAYLTNPPKSPGMVDLLISPKNAIAQRIEVEKGRLFEDEAGAVLAIAKAAPPADPRLHVMFDLYVHDSLAGFDHGSVELSGYWRYRRGFVGNEKRMVAENNAPPNADRAVA
jgi:hypothetical protein